VKMVTDKSMLVSSNLGDSGPRTSADPCASSTLSTSSRSLLDRLQAPGPSEVSRKRRVHTNPPLKRVNDGQVRRRGIATPSQLVLCKEPVSFRVKSLLSQLVSCFAERVGSA